MVDEPGTFIASIALPHGSVTFVFGGHVLDHIAALVRAHGLAAYEPPAVAVFAALVRDSDDLVLDIGSNTGLFALLAAAANPQLHVRACEPLEQVRTYLQANLARNPDLAPRIVVEPFGVSSTCGRLPFFETINDQGLLSTSSSLELDHAKDVGKYRAGTVRVTTLDGWADALGQAPIQLVKIDVEGHEHAVVAGGRNTIKRHRPFIIVEILGPARTEVFDRVLIDDGYLDFALAPHALRQCLTVRFHPDAWNHLLCPAEKASRILTLCRQLDLRIEIG